VSSDAFHLAVAQIEHIALATNDVGGCATSTSCWGATASLPSADPGTGLRSCALDFCGVRLELFERPGRAEGAVGDALAPGLLHIGFALGSADAVDELSRVIATAGHRVLERPHRTGERGPL